MARTPFEKNYGVLKIFYSNKLDLGLMLGLRPRRWFRNVWGIAECDVIWYHIGPLEFFRAGRY